MSTRGIIGFVVDDTAKITYNHSDSYPEWLGVRALRFLQERLPSGFDQLVEQARALEVIDDSIPPTAEQKTRLAPYADLSVSEQSLDDWYCLLRTTQGNLDLMLEVGTASDGFECGVESLFCEWGYVIDLDRRVLDVYEGFNPETPTEGLWAGRPTVEDGEEDYAAHVEYAKTQSGPRGAGKPWLDLEYFTEKDYKGVKLITSFPFADGLPDEETFLKTVKAASRYPEDEEN